MLSFYKITKFDYDDSKYLEEWMDIEEFVELKGTSDFSEYLFWEDAFVRIYINFCDYTEYTLAAKIFDDDLDLLIKNNRLPNYIMDNLGLPFSEYDIIRRTAFDCLSKTQKEFIFRCHLRGICCLHLISTSGAFLKPMGDSFYAQLSLYDSESIWDVIDSKTPMFCYYDMDHDNDSDDYEAPENYGEKILRNV